MHSPEFAGFWIRLLATLIDVIAISLVIAGPLTYIYGPEYWQSNALFQGFWDVILGWVLPISATIWFWLKYRATPGKLLTGLQIVDADSMMTMDLRQAVLRYVMYIVAMVPLFLGLIWVAFDSRKQGWHDKVAKTLVIKEL